METQNAQSLLKDLLASRKVFCLTVKRLPSGARDMRYFIHQTDADGERLTEITGIIARAMESKRWNASTGNYRVAGGDGADTINSLSIRLFNDHNHIQTQTL